METDLQTKVLNFESIVERIFPGSSYQSSKITSRKVSTVGRRPSTLTGHYAAWKLMVVIQKLPNVYDVMCKAK